MLQIPPRWLKRRCREFPAHKQVFISFTGPPQWRKLLSPSFLAPKQACTSFAAPIPRLKRLFRVFPAHKHVCTSCTGPLQWWKLFLDLYWHFHRPARASQPLFGGENGVVLCFQHMNWFSPASQDLHSCENCFLFLFWHLKRPPRTLQHLGG